MTSRKEWRNRDASAGERVLGLLEALREGLGAKGVALFDDDRAVPNRQPPNFWDAFDQRPCAEIDWAAWYGSLRADGRVETLCGCDGQHHLFGFLIHDRWALLVVAPPSPVTSIAVTSSLSALAEQLPPAMKPVAPPADDDDAALPPGSGGLLWWVRKAPE